MQHTIKVEAMKRRDQINEIISDALCKAYEFRPDGMDLKAEQMLYKKLTSMLSKIGYEMLYKAPEAK